MRNIDTQIALASGWKVTTVWADVAQRSPLGIMVLRNDATGDEWRGRFDVQKRTFLDSRSVPKEAGVSADILIGRIYREVILNHAA